MPALKKEDTPAGHGKNLIYVRSGKGCISRCVTTIITLLIKYALILRNIEKDPGPAVICMQPRRKKTVGRITVYRINLFTVKFGLSLPVCPHIQFEFQKTKFYPDLKTESPKIIDRFPTR